MSTYGRGGGGRRIARRGSGARVCRSSSWLKLAWILMALAVAGTTGPPRACAAGEQSADGLGDGGLDEDRGLDEQDDFDYWEARRQHSADLPVSTAADEERGLNLNVQAGHLAFDTFGRNDSITPVELFPFVRVHDDLFFGHGRLFVTNGGDLGGNAGVGYRLQSDWGEVYGVSLWYDADDTTGELFHQVGLSLELLSEVWEARANGYLPVGDRSQDFSVQFLNQRFVGTSLVFDRDRRWGEALPGLDVELGVLVPGQLAEEHDLRVFAGWYYFAGDEAENINGFKARVQGDLLAGLSSQVEFTTDDTFGTNVMLGISWAYDEKYRARSAGRPRRDRLSEFVRRNYNIIVSRQRELTPGLVAVNGETGAPFVIQHLNNNGGPLLSGPPSGTVDSPFTSLADARAAGGDFIFVHGGSVINEQLVLQSGDRLIGEGGEYAVNVAGVGDVLLPRATSGSSRPLIQGTSGDSVVLASNTVFSGFIIENPGGHGIVGTGVGNMFVSHVDVRNAAGSGIRLENASGPVAFESLRIENAAGPGLHVAGGSGRVSYGGSIFNQSDFALLVENTTGGTVDLSGASIVDEGGQGILIDQADGDVVIGSTRIDNSTAAGIEIRGGAGDVHVGRATVLGAAASGIKIDAAAGAISFGEARVTAAGADAAVSVTDSPGSTSFDVLSISSDGGAGLEVLDSGRISVADGTIAAVGGSAAVLRDTTMDISLTSVSSDGAAHGLEFINTPGRFVVQGVRELGSGGTIQNATVAGILIQNAGSVGLQNVDLTDNALGINASAVDWLALSRTRVTGSTNFGLDVRNSTLVEIANSLFAGNGGSSGASIRLVNDTLADSVFALATSTIIADSGDAIQLATAAGGEDSTLQIALINNAIGTTGAGGSGLRASWDGAMSLLATGNAFAGTAASNTGVLLDLPSATEASGVSISNNSFSFSGSDSTAVDVTGAGPTAVLVDRNAIGFTGTSGTGLAFALSGGANVNLSSNVIADAAGGATAILFRSMAGESNVIINDNLVNLVGGGILVDRGIVFTSISGTVHLFGTTNNRVNLATQAFSAPAGATVGTILVNGAAVP